jgi:hypothetical protein
MRRPSIRKSSVTTVAATAVVLAIASTGGAVAGGLVTSAKIKNNTIKSIDVRNGSLTGADLAPGTIPAPYGGTYAYSTFHDAAVALVPGLTPTTVLTLNIPSAGSYVASATTVVNNASASEASIACSLVADGDNDTKSVFVQKLATDSHNRDQYALQVVHTFGGPGTVRLACQTLGTTISAANAKVTAVKVDHLSNVAG